MKKVVVVLSVVLMVLAVIIPGQAEASPSCWGQATAVFAQTGEMGEHASQEPTPRLGLANLADALADAGIIEEGTMEALGAFVASELGLSIDACMD